MEKKQNFLDVLEQKVFELQGKGVISEEELRKGLEIQPEWLFSTSVSREDFLRAITEYLINHSKNYYDNCIGLKKDPNKLSKLSLSKHGDHIQIDSVGNDEWSKLFITNNIDEKNEILQITPEEFADEVYERTIARKQWEATKKTGKGVNLFEVRKIFNAMMDTQMINAIKEAQKTGLSEMSENLASYYEYLKQEEKNSKILYAGFRNRKEEARCSTRKDS